ncbi:ABC transporter permease [Alloscardovia venturai]|uniref:ABC transporter permease n=1 Tax=Alloscardovia venturai TaxID=1769421 RepID=A0ABW2Y4P5_9BIFI
MAVEKHYVPQIRSGAINGEKRGKTPRVKGLSTKSLKIFVLILAFFSVAATTIFPHWLGTESMAALTISVLSEIISWGALPLAAWLIVQGFEKTRSRFRYTVLLAGLSLVTQIPYSLATTGHVLDFSSVNFACAGFITVCVLNVLARLDSARAVYKLTTAWYAVLTVLTWVIGAVWMLMMRVGVRQKIAPLGVVFLGFAAIFYYLKNKENTMMLSAAVLGALCMIAPGITVVALHFRNDELGYDKNNSVVKYMFYLAYPLILIVCVALAFV